MLYLIGLIVLLVAILFLFKTTLFSQVGYRIFTPTPTISPSLFSTPSPYTNPPPEGGCNTDADCPAGAFCEQVQCITAPCNKQCISRSPIVNNCGVDPDKDGNCPPGCVNYGVPLGCITQKEFDDCEKSKYGCPICLSSSTSIETEKGSVNVKQLKVGMNVWTVNNNGKKELQPIIKLSTMNSGNNHRVSRISLDDGRTIDVSPNHPTIDNKTAGQLKPGDLYDGSIVQTNKRILYAYEKTYDLLPDGSTGYYFANGILMGSTLK